MRVIDLGLMPWQECTDYQKQLQSEVIDGAEDTLIFVEHPPVLTLGASFHAENLLFSRAQYEAMGIEVVPTDRGGDVTFHGPRQLVIYPVFDVSRHGRDLHKWLRDLEETMILTCRSFNLKGYRFPPNTGVWVDGQKVAAIGIKIRRWVSMHGIALNCDNDLNPFQTIVPCGIRTHGVTSLSRELDRVVTIEEAKPAVQNAFRTTFNL